LNLTILLQIALAAAQPVTRPVTPVSVARIPCAAAVSFASPYAWHYASDLPAITDAVALVVIVGNTVDERDSAQDLLRPKNIGQRVLYADGWPVEILALDPGRSATELASGAAPGRALVLAPVTGLGPDAALRVYFGDDALPERIDAAHRKQSLAEAAGIAPLSPDAVVSPAWAVPAGTLRQDWIAGLVEWAAACK
jgi:hypothetical protein